MTWAIKNIYSFISKGFPMNIDPKEPEKVIKKRVSVIETGNKLKQRNLKEKGGYNGKSII